MATLMALTWIGFGIGNGGMLGTRIAMGTPGGWRGGHGGRQIN